MQWIAKIKNLLAIAQPSKHIATALQPPAVLSPPEDIQAQAIKSPVAVSPVAHAAYQIDPLSTDNDSFGSRAQSPDGRWVLSWKWLESTTANSNAQAPSKSHYQLVDSRTQSVVAKGELDRPNAGQVANNGYFCFEDWHDGNDQIDTFRVFDSSGVQIIENKVRSTLTKSAISRNGMFAVFQTLNGFTEDGNKLFLIDLVRKKLVYAVAPDAGWADRYDIDETSGEVVAQFKGLGSFRYGPSGHFLDAGALARAKLASNKYEICVPAAEKILLSPDLNPAMAQSTLSAIDRLFATGSDGIDLWKSKCLKLKGFAYEELGDLPSALESFDQALALDYSAEIESRRKQILEKMHKVSS
ncbi:tetratricopeptide repeat protein [Pseudomonas sp. 5P_3.1_Bac2]|uniref:tetratricopeptide repeat protein n=1 Tax=Pseudomonas sp. 5P_3.1_Bac2 TaxID=2971617 RepID=UPI0021C9CE21|nr:tetratricopeptide repeat protein [Pseudomonas sp. 5P_3.1_Bac2]MCU1717131.1 tetratricopeptide repeat protein [Pseudomonas sp. 5P_3.1_Bac2]